MKYIIYLLFLTAGQSQADYKLKGIYKMEYEENTFPKTVL